MYEEVKREYEKLGGELIELLKLKREAYGDNLKSTGRFLSLLYPDGVPSSALPELGTMIRVVDKLFRIANRHKAEEEGKGWEDNENPWWDIAGYGLATVADRAVEGKKGG